MKGIKDRGAQGDILFRRVSAVPSGAKRVERTGGVLVAGHSETGHHHVVEQHNVTMFEVPGNPLVAYLQLEGACEVGGGIDVVHQRPWDTHEMVRLLGTPAGGDVFEIRRQREWAPEGWRRVAD
jgi:hypothetical protein